MSAKHRQSKKKDDPHQSRLFIEAARELGADGDQSEADAILGHLHKKPPHPHKKTGEPKKDQ